jgi:thiol-disulfide isomerase/thioredoxin
MQMTRRHAVLAVAGLAAAGTVAAVTLRRKPSDVVTLDTPGLPTVMRERITAPPIANPAPPPPGRFFDAAGQAHTLDEFRGKGVLVNLWATWCSPCVAEMPALAALARRVANQGIVVLPISSDHGGAETVQHYYASHAITGLGVWLDPKGLLGEAWGVNGLPTTLILDRAGRERLRLEGAYDWTADGPLATLERLTA